MEGLPLLSSTSDGWARLAAENLGAFLADHAVCEQQAALTALNLVAHYPDDEELVDRMISLATEEIAHFRKVVGLLRQRGLRPARRRRNPYVQGLRSRLGEVHEPRLKADRLLVGALIEARSCERFTSLLGELAGREEDVSNLLRNLAPAEERHWELFFRLASRDSAGDWFDARWRWWLEWESELNSRGGLAPAVHG
jgi:tRNA-(ms[2]io[6]A)-hydroxylase